MDFVLRDLLAHQLWADAEVWHAIAAHAPARTDKTIHDRLHHIHQVQRAFMWVVGDRSTMPAITKPEEYAGFDALRDYARAAHSAVRAGVDALPPGRTDERVSIPWFRDPPLTITVGEALTQMAMHSQWHRSQNATRLRELGGDPPMVDLIVWYWKGRPSSEL